MSSLLFGVRCVAVLGPQYTQVRGAKRWLRPYLMMLERKKRLEQPPKPVPRYQQPHFDYHAEIVAFSKRLNETFSTDLLKTAFVNQSYVVKEERERRELGLDKETATLNLQDNRELAQNGLDFTVSYLSSALQQAFPNIPDVGVEALVDYFTSQQVLCHIATNLGFEDLTLSSECPLSPETLQRTFYGVVGALLQSSDADKAGIFLQDFLIPELIGKDLFDLWSVKDPMSLLVQQLSQRNIPPPEPRLTRQSGASTVLPVYFVGLYCNKQLIAEAPGETVFAAEEEAARVALRKMFGFVENQRPWDYSPSRQGTGDNTALNSVC
ncbi:PREDICTED: 39S ribosomal protein L44, mitochondrial [Nanorana parkeri]|uniref:39S ribosomal protein L44, mitochondrial n=1 Tax=Nanorana parkeri TaxID=125878 RepID=UPI000854CFAB|nr:PREDICTED: 39S ribosomal protein L44, mitochondrial [Nanorana parkeri]